MFPSLPELREQNDSALVLSHIAAAQQFREILEILLTPSIEWVFVALGALDSQAQESMSKANGNGLSVSEFSSHPIVGHRFGFAERFVCGGFLHAFTEIDVAFATVAADAEDDPFDHFIVGSVVFDTFVDPVIPLLTWKIAVKSNVT